MQVKLGDADAMLTQRFYDIEQRLVEITNFIQQNRQPNGAHGFVPTPASAPPQQFGISTPSHPKEI